MSQNTLRTIIIFSIIALGLGGALVFGVRFLKARDNAYASNQQQSHTTSQPQPSRAPAEHQSPATATDNQQKSSGSSSSTSQPQPAANPPQQTSPSGNTTMPPAPDTATRNLPATSGSKWGLIVTTVLVMLAAVFSGQLLRAQASFRRYIKQDVAAR